MSQIDMEKIIGVQFGIVGPEMIGKISAVKIVSSDLYDTDGYPIEGGVMDPRLGVVDPGLACRTCGGNLDDCNGHFGFVELARPIVHVLYAKQIYALLKMTCKKCSRIMFDPKKGKASVAEITKTPPTKCPHCKAKQSKIEFEKTYTFYDDKKEMKQTMIRERFENISDDDLKVIGFKGGRPEWLILTLFPVPPVTVRPSITLETGERSEDDLTHKLTDIVRINQSLKENIDIGAPEFILDDLWELVQYHISTYFDNELSGVPHARHRSGRPLKGLIQRLKAKEGRIRGNLLGKRVNFSSRTVISPDPKLSINEVGVPYVVAEELTIPEHVTPFNEKELKKAIKDGKVNYLNRPDGRRIKVTADNKKLVIENITIGWTVERQLKDGDIVVFNRQHSLHRMSIMSHRVKLMPGKTFRMNPSVCPPYNADFDGDEMNLHALQTSEARTEAEMLMSVEKNIISPKFGGPVIGCDLDQITGTYLLNLPAVQLTKQEASYLLGLAGLDIEVPDKPKLKGSEIFSLILPKELNMEYKSGTGDIVKIKNGQVLEGTIDSRSVGAFKGRIITKIFELKGDNAAMKFINECGKLATGYLMFRGITIGISDIDLKKDVQKKISEEVRKATKKSDTLIQEFGEGEIDLLPGMNEAESLEVRILNVLAGGLNSVSSIVEANLPVNDVINLARAGAKGSIVNTTQMAACVGQETIMGKRIRRGYLGRTLPHYVKGDLSAEAHGFVARGFKDGLTPFEVFWNIMNGREGLMDKSLRTRKSGYMQRRLVNALQDLKVEADNTVKSIGGRVIQFKVGEDAVNPSKSYWGEIDLDHILKE